METDALIQSLSAKATPVAPGAVARRILIGLGVGAATSILLMIAWLGVRPDIGHAMATGMFWVKFAYTAHRPLPTAASPGWRGRAKSAFALASQRRWPPWSPWPYARWALTSRCACR